MDQRRLDQEGEVGPIVFRPEPGRPSPVEPVDHITFPPLEPRSEPVAEPDEGPPAPPLQRRPGGMTKGLALGIVAGVAVGAAAALFALHRLGSEPATESNLANAPDLASPPSEVLAQALTTQGGPAAIPAAPAPAPPRRAAEQPQPRPKRLAGLDLDRLARRIAAATPPSAAATPPGVGDASSFDAEPAAPAPIPPPPAPTPAPAIVSPPIEIAKPVPPPAIQKTPPAKVAPPPVVRADPDIAQAEQRLRLAYDRAMASAPDRAVLHAEQQRWLAQKSRFASKKPALMAYYQARIDSLLEQDRVERKKGGIARLLRD
jgi:hypothetical protein